MVKYIFFFCIILVSLTACPSEKCLINVNQQNGDVIFEFYNASGTKNVKLKLIAITVLEKMNEKKVWRTKRPYESSVKERYYVSYIKYGEVLEYHEELVPAQPLMKGKEYIVYISYLGNGASTEFVYEGE